jgi:hypothetical protein
MNLEAIALEPEDGSPGIKLSSNEQLLAAQHDRVVEYVKDFYKQKGYIATGEPDHAIRQEAYIKDLFHITYMHGGESQRKGSVSLRSFRESGEKRTQYKIAKRADFACGTINSRKTISLLYFNKGKHSKTYGDITMRNMFLEQLTLHGYAMEIQK